MVKKALEGEKPKVEEAEEQLTPPEVEPTVKTYTEDEFRHELDKALGKGLESTNRQLSLQRVEAEAAKAEAAQHKAEREAIDAEVKILREEQDKLLGSETDPDIRRSYTDRIAIARERAENARKLAEATQKLQTAERLAYSVKLAQKASELVRETGISPVDLEACQSETEMEVKALRFKLAQAEKKEPEEKESEVIQPDAGVSTGSATSFARVQARYAEGDASREEYEKSAREAGVAI